MSTDKPKDRNQLNFGQKISNFFKTIGCCGGDRDDISIRPKGSKKPKTFNISLLSNGKPYPDIPISSDFDSNYNDDDHQSDFSCTDLEDLRTYKLGEDQPNLCWPTQIYKTSETTESMSEIPYNPLFAALQSIRTEEVETKKRDDSPQPETSQLIDNTVSVNSKKINKAKSKKKESVVSKPSLTESSEAEDSKKRKQRRTWQPHEDAIVLDMVSKYGQSWSLVSSFLEGRSGKQIRDRYLNKLMPNINTSKWTNMEDQQLLHLYFQIGNKWSTIAGHMKGRTETQVKNRFYSHIKKKILCDMPISPLRVNPNAPANTNQVPDLQLSKTESTSKITVEEEDLLNVGLQITGGDAPELDMISYENPPVFESRKASSSTKTPKMSGLQESWIGFPLDQEKNPMKITDLNSTERSTSKSVVNMMNEINLEDRKKNEADEFEKLAKRRYYLEQLIEKTERDMKRINPNITFEKSE